MILSTVTDEVLTDRSPSAFPRIFETAVREGVRNFEIRMVEAKRFPVCEAGAWDRMKFFAGEYGITFSAVSPGLFKAGRIKNSQMHWQHLGLGETDIKGQIEALKADGYAGTITLEAKCEPQLDEDFPSSIRYLKSIM